jgi:hypothetical protein
VVITEAGVICTPVSTRFHIDGGFSVGACSVGASQL